MAIEFFTGFEGCGSWNQAVSLFDFYTKSNYCDYQFSTSVGYLSSKAIGFDGRTTYWGNSGYYQKSCSSALQKVVGFHRNGFCRQPIGVTNFRGSLVYFVGPNISIFYDGNVWHITRGGTLIFEGAGNPEIIPPLNGVFHAEVKCVVDISEGSIELKINKEYAFQLFNLNTGSSPITSVTFGYGYFDGVTNPWAWYAYYDNIFISDDWEGVLYSVLLTPIEDIAVNFTPSGGVNNYSLLTTNDGDTSYVFSDTINHVDLYDFQSLDSLLLIKAFTQVAVARIETGSDKFLKLVSSLNSIEYEETGTITLSTSYPGPTTNLCKITKELSVDGSELTTEKFNTTNFGFKLIG